MGRKGWILSALLVTVCSLAGCGLEAADDAESAVDDGWRRTAEGWVHVDELRAESHGIPPRQPDRFITDELTRPATPRWDFHPAALALGQILVAAAAFAGVRKQVAAIRNSGSENHLDGQSRKRRAA